MIMKRSELRKVIREIIERELSSEMFPIRNTEFDETDDPLIDVETGILRRGLTTTQFKVIWQDY